jgi:hypothetical protein
MSNRQKKLFELQQRLKASRKASRTAVMAERRRKLAPDGADEAYEKRKWLEEKKNRKHDDLEKLGLEEKDVSTSINIIIVSECNCKHKTTHASLSTCETPWKSAGHYLWRNYSALQGNPGQPLASCPALNPTW